MITRFARGAFLALALAGCGLKSPAESVASQRNDSNALTTASDPAEAAIVAHYFNTASIAQDQAATLVGANAQTQLALDGGANAGQ